MIIKTSCGRFYSVRPTEDASLEHVWFGFQVKHVAGHWTEGGNVGPSWVRKAKAREELVRKAATRVVEA